MDTCVCMAQSLHRSPDTIPTLLISHPPIKIKKMFLRKKRKKKFDFPGLIVILINNIYLPPT